MINKKSLKSLLERRFENDKITSLSLLPKPDIFIDIEKAFERVKIAINTNQTITIIGDYDVDGVVSSALMKLFFDQINYPVKIIIPNRFVDGYGLSAKLASCVDSDLVITVDNGINALEAADILRQKSIDLIIIDHHTPGVELPNSIAIIHPKFTKPQLQTTEICAALVAWYFIAGLKNVLNIDIDIKKLLQLVSIATIADVMPLVCINRTVVKTGLEQLNRSDMPFAKAMQRLSKTKFKSDDIAFKIAPRLNSAGRMSDAMIAFEFLCSTTEAEAIKKLDELNSLNEMRKNIELETYNNALKQVVDKDLVIVVSGFEWHEGVLGIVASRLSQRFKKPTIVLSANENIAKGSARSTGNVNIYDLINVAKEYIIAFGGHRAAAGLSLECSKIDDFKNIINNAASRLSSSKFESASDCLGELDLSELDSELFDILDLFEPYGQMNEKPKFLLNSADVHRIEIIGRDSNVTKFYVSNSSICRLGCIFFGLNNALSVGKATTFSYNVIKNHWNGTVKYELQVGEFL